MGYVHLGIHLLKNPCCQECSWRAQLDFRSWVQHAAMPVEMAGAFVDAHVIAGTSAMAAGCGGRTCWYSCISHSLLGLSHLAAEYVVIVGALATLLR